MFVKTLLPENHRIRKVGERDIKNYWAFGKNYPASGNEYESLYYGDWRIEVQPSTAQKSDVFLHVLEAADTTQAEMTPVQLVDEGNYYGVVIDDPALTYNKVLFSKTTAGDYKVTSDTSTPRPQITLTKSVDKAEAYSGQELTYTITYTNSGSAEAKDVVITDAIPAGTTYVAGFASSGGVLSGSTLTWMIASLSSGGSGSVSFKVKID